MKKLNVLLVEDEPSDAYLIVDYLSENYEFECVFTQVKTLKETLTELHTNAFDIVLLDLGLPDSSFAHIIL